MREGARAAAASGLRETLGVRALVEILDRDTIPRAGYKATRVIYPA